METYELKPKTSQKSFYGKATVIVNDKGEKFLKSYDTIVMKIDHSGKKFRTWDDFSATTGKHIAAFAGLNKKEYLNLPFYDVKCEFKIK